MVWYDMVWYGINSMVWCGAVWCVSDGVVWCGLVWYGLWCPAMVWSADGIVRYGRYATVLERHGTLCCGTVCYGAVCTVWYAVLVDSTIPDLLCFASTHTWLALLDLTT